MNTGIGILPGWYGMENGQKPEMQIKMENGPKLDRGKDGKKMAQKWKNNGKLPQNPFFCLCPALGRFPFRFPFPALLAVFHAIPARQDANTGTLSLLVICLRRENCNMPTFACEKALLLTYLKLDWVNLSTLPALQKPFVEFFFVFAWEFCIEKWRGFLVIFSGLRFPRNAARKLLEDFGKNSA